MTSKQVKAYVTRENQIWIGTLHFSQELKPGEPFPFTPSLEVVAAYAKLMVHPYQASSQESALWHETYLQKVEYNKKDDSWVVVIVEPNLD